MFGGGILGLGILLLILGFFFAHILWVIGVALVIIGVVLYFVGGSRRSSAL